MIIRVLFVVAVLSGLSGCIRSAEPYFDDTHQGVVAMLPDQATILFGRWHTQLQLKPGSRATFESDAFDNVLIVASNRYPSSRDTEFCALDEGKLEREEMAGHAHRLRGMECFIAQATHKASGVTFYVPFKNHGYAGRWDAANGVYLPHKIQGQDVGFHPAISPQVVDENAYGQAAALVMSMGKPHRTAEVKGVEIKSYNIKLFHAFTPRIFEPELSEDLFASIRHVEVLNASGVVSVRKEDVADFETQPNVIIMDRAVPAQRAFAERYVAERGVSLAVIAKEQEVRRFDRQILTALNAYMLKDCGRLEQAFAMADQASQGMSRMMSGRFSEQNGACALQVLSERVTFRFSEEVAHNCISEIPQQTCRIVYSFDPIEESNFGAGATWQRQSNPVVAMIFSIPTGAEIELTRTGAEYAITAFRPAGAAN